jgi:hypothetical protein
LDEQKAITVQSVMPNPFKNNLEINFASATELNLEVQVSNLKGEIMFTKTLNTEAGMQKISLAEAETLAEGIYFLKLTTNGISEVHKLIKVKN